MQFADLAACSASTADCCFSAYLSKAGSGGPLSGPEESVVPQRHGAGRRSTSPAQMMHVCESAPPASNGVHGVVEGADTTIGASRQLDWAVKSPSGRLVALSEGAEGLRGTLLSALLQRRDKELACAMTESAALERSLTAMDAALRAAHAEVARAEAEAAAHASATEERLSRVQRSLEHEKRRLNGEVERCDEERKRAAAMHARESARAAEREWILHAQLEAMGAELDSLRAEVDGARIDVVDIRSTAEAAQQLLQHQLGESERRASELVALLSAAHGESASARRETQLVRADLERQLVEAEGRAAAAVAAAKEEAATATAEANGAIAHAEGVAAARAAEIEALEAESERLCARLAELAAAREVELAEEREAATEVGRMLRERLSELEGVASDAETAAAAAAERVSLSSAS
eukprot:4299284-Pleurochrysis_carterae.AAC.3